MKSGQLSVRNHKLLTLKQRIKSTPLSLLLRWYACLFTIIFIVIIINISSHYWWLMINSPYHYYFYYYLVIFFYFILFYFFGVQRLYNVSILFSVWQSTPLACSPPSSSVAFSNILESQEQENTNLNRYVRLFTVITYIQQNHISLCECWMVSHLLLWCSYWPICSIFFGFII